MGRPTKQGLDFFYLDTKWDKETKRYIDKTGAKGISVYLVILQNVYSKHGYFAELDDMFIAAVRTDLCEISIKETIACICNAVRHGLFSDEKLELYGIITSNGIQKRYFDAAKRKKKINVCNNYLMPGINPTLTAKDAYINPIVVNVDKNGKRVIDSKNRQLLLTEIINGYKNKEYDVIKSELLSTKIINVDDNATKVKEKVKEKEKKGLFFLSFFDFLKPNTQRVMASFIDQKEQDGNPFSEDEIKHLADRCKKFEGDGIDLDEAIIKATEKGWRKIYPPNGKKQNEAPAKPPKYTRAPKDFNAGYG